MAIVRDKGKSLLVALNDFVVVDLETTGFSPVNDKIIEIGAIKVSDGFIVGEYSTLVNPMCGVSQEILDLTGIRGWDLYEAKEMKELVSDFHDFVGDSILVGHNVNFDVNFLYEDILKYMGVKFQNDFVDTLKMARKLLPELENHKLDTLMKYFSIKERECHRALDDCIATLDVYNGLCELL